MKILTSKPYLWLELLVLILGIPAAIYYFHGVRYLLPILWGMGLYCYLVHRHLTGNKWKQDWNWAAVNRKNLKPILLRFAACALFLAVATWILMPERLFSFVLERPHFWLLVMVAYPILSVIPQEIIFRLYFFERYKTILGTKELVVIVSALGFGLAHVIFQNWIAPLLCVIGGLMFALTYSKQRSLALVSLEHALFGDFLFTVGLGFYFYHGSVAMAANVAQ